MITVLKITRNENIAPHPQNCLGLQPLHCTIDNCLVMIINYVTSVETENFTKKL